jgi:CBS domain-containing protein
MSNLARDLMTADPQCCTADTPLNEVAKLMVDCDCGEIPVVEGAKLIGVVTDRDIVCRVVAKGKNPSDLTAKDAMTQPVISVTEDCSLEEVLAKMEEHQVRRLPVVDGSGCVCGIVSQADVALAGKDSDVGEMVREVSRDAIVN